MRTALLVLALLAAPAFASQTVWKWVDEKGVTHYTDRPVPGATRVEISVGSRVGTVRTEPSAAAPASNSNRNTPAATGYREFVIWKPGDGDSVINTGGMVEVRMRLDPELQSGHSIYVYLNGQLVEDYPPTALDYTIREVPRGQHSLRAIIQDGRGQRVSESPAVRFNVRQESVAQPPVGPALRPQTPPKPRN